MRGLPPDVFEVRLHRHAHNDSTSLEVWSRMYDIRLGFQIRRMWGDPRPIADFAETLIGGTVRSWFESRVGTASGRDMSRALLPHWEREIHRFMERVEYEGRRRDTTTTTFFDEVRNISPDQWDALRYGLGDFQREDPKAKEKARQLLMRNLDDGQTKSFKKDGSFRVTAKDGKAYTIKTARSFNVEGPDGTKYCGQLADTPIEDQMLAQKLLLEHEPDKFFKNANVSPAQQQEYTAHGINARMRAMESIIMQPGAIVGFDSAI